MRAGGKGHCGKKLEFVQLGVRGPGTESTREPHPNLEIARANTTLTSYQLLTLRWNGI